MYLDETTSLVQLTGYPGRNLVVPDCIFSSYLPALTSLIFSDVLIFGNPNANASVGSALRDPFTRLVSNATTISFTSVKFADSPSSSGVTPGASNWDAFFAAHPRLTSLTVAHSNIAGSLPSSMPTALKVLALNNNALTGTIPNDFLSGSRASMATFSVDLSSNRLSGSIPTDFIGNLNLQAATNVKISIANNSFTGVLPRFLANSQMANCKSLSIDLSRNNLTGSIATAWMSGLSSVSALQYFDLFIGYNELYSVVPVDLLSFIRADTIQTLTLALNNNLLAGTVPTHEHLTTLAAVSSTLATLQLNYGGNLFAVLPDRLFPENAQTPLLKSVTLRVESNHLNGSLPAALISSMPSSITSLVLDMSSNTFSGNVPTGWLRGATAQITDFVLSLDNNALEGSPFTELLDYAVADFRRFAVSASNNKFEGALPPILGSSLILNAVNSPRFSFDVSNNTIDGLFTAAFFDAFRGMALGSFSLDLSSNAVYGGLPNGLFNGLNVDSLTLDLSRNKISSIVPLDLISYSTGASLNINLASNLLTDGLNTALYRSRNSGLTSLSLNFDGNPLGGTIPASLFASSGSHSIGSMSVSYKDCSLVGTVPTTTAVYQAHTVRLFFDDNRLNGSLPLPAILGGLAVVGRDVTFSASGNSFTDAISLPNKFLNDVAVNVNLSRNDFGSIIFGSNTQLYIRSLDVSRNAKLAGTLPNDLFAITSVLQVLIASHTNITGSIANLGLVSPWDLNTLNLSLTAIDFCSGTRDPFWSYELTSCSLANTTATSCRNLYPPICATGMAPEEAPSPNPTNPSPSPCLASTKPGPSFICINGMWTTTSVIDTPVLVLPPGSTETIIVDADIISSEIVFNGLGASISLSGCATNLSQVTITLTLSELESIKDGKTQLLISYTNTSCNDLSNVDVSVKVEGSSCRKLKASKAVASGTLSSVFSVDTSRCNRWWIILVSVVCGVVVLAVLVIVLLIALVPAVRLKLRPYSAKRAQSTA